MSEANSVTSQPNRNVQINTSRGDRVNGILIASLVMFGFLFAVLFAVWWFHEIPVARNTYLPPPPPPPTTPITPVEDDFESDVVEFEGSTGTPLEDLIETVNPSVVNFSDVKGAPGDGIGDVPGPGRDPQTVPPSGVAGPQWSVVQASDDLESYQRKLDFFGIEIGAVHKTRDQVWRITKLSTEKIVTESTRSAESRVRYFVNKKKRLQQWDRQTIAAAGVDLQDVIAVHFYPSELVEEMQQLVDAKYGDHASKLQQVTFKIAGAAGDLHFEIDNVKFGN